MPVSSSTEHWIKPDALTINLNHFGDPDYLQVSVLAGAVVMAFKQDVIGYNAAHNYRTWPLEAANTYLETSSAYNVYARLTRSEVNARALVVYDTVLRDIEGREISYAVDEETGETVEVLGDANPDYFYMYLGQISASVNSNGESVQREWTIDFRAGNLDTNQYRNEESTGEWSKMFRLNKVTDLIEVLKTISSAVINKLTVAKELVLFGKSVKNLKRSTDTSIQISDESIPTTKQVEAYTEKKFLRKDEEDSTSFLTKFLAGIEVGDTTGNKGTIIDALGRIISECIELRSTLTIGKEGFMPGMTGFGGHIDEYANAELESLVIRRFLEVPELRYNRVEVKVGDKWRAPGGGVIERVEPILDADGNPTGEGFFWLKLEDGEIGAVAHDDICMGIFHDFNNPSNNETVDSDDGLGNRTFSGFCTAYWRIEEVADYTDENGTHHNKQVRYSIRPTSDRWSRTFEPMPMMNFVCYGNFTNPERQTSVYETRTYTRMLKNQNSWNFELANVALQYGDMSNFTALGRNVSNKYSLYVGDIYMTGSLTSVDIDGQPILNVIDKGEWKEGTVAAYYERYSYNGSLWLCVNESGTNQPPSETDPSWLEQVKSGQSVTSQPNWDSSKVPYPASTILKFAERIWISNKETSAAPFPLYTDPNGNYYKTPEGGYYIASETQSADWDLLLDVSGLMDGEDGESIEVRYSADGTNWHFPYKSGDIYMQQRIGSESAWSDIIQFVGEDGKKGADGKYTDYQFAKNKSLTDAPTTGWQETPPAIGEDEYLWMRMRVVDPTSETEAPWSAGVRLGGEEGTSVFKSTVFIRTNDTPSTPEGGSYASPVPTTTGWSDGIPDGEQILWASTRVFTHNGKKPQEDVWTTPRKMTDTADFDVEFSSVENPEPPQGHPNTNVQWSNESGTDTIWMATCQKKNGVWGEWKVSKIKGEKGDMGVSITTHGQWKSGMTVPVMGVVTMGGNAYIAKKETSNPPLWCYTDPNGNFYLTHDGGYYLTGEANTAEYDILVQSGKDGADGKDYEWIYQVKATEDIPSKPASVQQDDYVPSGWNDDPTGVSETLPYEFACVRTKKDGLWSEYSTPAIWAKFGKDGQNAVYADMSNEMDSVALSSDGKTTKAWELTTTATVWNGQTKVPLKSISISQVGGVTTSYNLTTGIITFNIAKDVTIAEHNELNIVVTAHINGIDVVRTLTFTLAGVKAGVNGEDAVLYDIVVSASQIVKMKDGSYSIANISAYRNKTIGSTTQKTTEGTLKYSIDGGTETAVGNDETIVSSKIGKKIQFIFYDANGVVVDKESVPVVEDGKDGKDGINAIYADMDNEMDSVALSSDGKTTKAWELTTTATVWNGQTKVPLKSISISQVGGVTTSYNLTTGIITFNIAKDVTIAEHNELNIVVTAHINGIDVVRTLTFTLAGVKAGVNGEDAVLYDIVVSASQIVKMKDGSYSIANISAYRNKTIGSTTQKTTEGTLKYSIDGGTETAVGNDETIVSSKIGKKIQFIFYDANGVVVDKESVPVVEDGKDGKDGINAIYADMDNEMDSVALTSDGKSTAATELSTTVTMWNGSTKASLKSISVSAVIGVTTSYTLSSGVVKFNIAKGTSIAEHNEFKITVVSTINGVDESRTLTFTLNGVKAGADGKAAVLYKLLLSVNSVTKKSDGTYSVDGVNAVRCKIEDGVTSITTEGKLKYLIDDKDPSKYETEIGNSVDIPSYAFADRVRFTFYNDEGYIVDRETVPMITDGAGFEMMGNWKSGLSVPLRGVVQMGGGTYVAKKATSRPPLFCYTDPDGNYYITPEGGYYLTGEVNTTDYETWAEKGEKGADGKDGVDGVGKDGVDGKDGAIGYSGCVTRTWNAYIATQTYRNDADAAPEDLEATGIRYLDVILAESSENASGYEAYECVKTCVGSNPIGQTYDTDGVSADGNWRTASNLVSAFIAKFIALDANIKFNANGQLVILDDSNKVVAGMTGSREDGNNVRIWAGAETPEDAPFKVYEDGSSYQKNAQVNGNIRIPWVTLTYGVIYRSEYVDVCGFNGSGVTDDKLILQGMTGAELLIAWGDDANGREMTIYNTVGMRGADVSILIPSGYAIKSGSDTYTTEFTIKAGYMYKMVGMESMWVVMEEINVDKYY